ncbi:adenosylcobinamide-GDP ribazoletransferase [Gemmatimonadetes bacterium T265]|nr:adenosylcobinamide-GDP ribazoletransferase [Gemmatimonadetes bacterium T265]
MWTAAVTELRVFFTAVMFLTRIPCPRWVGHDPAWLARSTAYFPLVGVVVGLVGGAALWAAARVWPPFVAAALSTAATVRVTGAFHEDALADSCDGFGGGWEPAQVLAIMKDSRIGSYGAVGLALVLLTKVGALAAIAAADAGTAARALVAAHTLGRWSSLPLIWGLPYVRQDEAGAKAKPFAAAVTGPRLAAGSALSAGVTAAALAPLGPAAVVAALALAAAVTALAARYFRRRIGGTTGDCLGAANQLVELATYLLLASAWLRR